MRKLDDAVLDRLSELLEEMDTSTLHSRVTLADDAHRLLAGAGLSWADFTLLLKAGYETSERINVPRFPPGLSGHSGYNLQE
jgi:hypothetical protein